MRLNRVLRSAVRLVKGIQIRVHNDQFEMAVISAIPWFKVDSLSALLGLPDSAQDDGTITICPKDFLGPAYTFKGDVLMTHASKM